MFSLSSDVRNEGQPKICGYSFLGWLGGNPKGTTFCGVSYSKARPTTQTRVDWGAGLRMQVASVTWLILADPHQAGCFCCWVVNAQKMKIAKTRDTPNDQPDVCGSRVSIRLDLELLDFLETAAATYSSKETGQHKMHACCLSIPKGWLLQTKGSRVPMCAPKNADRVGYWQASNGSHPFADLAPSPRPVWRSRLAISGANWDAAPPGNPIRELIPFLWKPQLTLLYFVTPGCGSFFCGVATFLGLV